jgi:hypothetical protein
MKGVKTKKTYVPSRERKKQATKAAVTRRATEWWEKEGRKASSARLCERCGAVYMDGHWHTSPGLSAKLKAAKRIMSGKHPQTCIECEWAEHGQRGKAAGFEGEVTLDGLKDPAEKSAVLATVRNFGKRAVKRDPQDRIIAIDDRGERVVVTTTENQMAAGIGRTVAAAFKGGKLKIVWSDDDLPVRVHWTRKP